MGWQQGEVLCFLWSSEVADTRLLQLNMRISVYFNGHILHQPIAIRIRQDHCPCAFEMYASIHHRVNDISCQVRLRINDCAWATPLRVSGSPDTAFGFRFEGFKLKPASSLLHSLVVTVCMFR